MWYVYVVRICGDTAICENNIANYHNHDNYKFIAIIMIKDICICNKIVAYKVLTTLIRP